MDRQLAMEVGGVVREITAIDCRDKDGCWVDFMRIRVKMDMLKPLRRVVCVVVKDGREVTYIIKYERLPIFYYIFGCIDHSTTQHKEM